MNNKKLVSRRWNASVLFILMNVFAAMNVAAQNVRFLTMEDNLASSRVTTVAQDKDGVIWISSECGLDRYDGARMRHYGEVRGDSLSLSSNYVRECYQATNGRFYVLTMKGLDLFDKKNDTFRSIPFYDKEGRLVPMTLVNAMVETPRYGTLVSTSGWGIYRLSQDGLRADKFFDNLGTRFVNTMYHDKRQRIWISTNDKGSFLILPNKKVINIQGPDGANSSVISCFVEGKNGTVYAGTEGHGVWKYDETRNCFVSVGGELFHFTVRNMFYDEGRILIGTWGNGMLQILDGSEEVTRVADLWLPIQMERCTPNHIMRDNKGNLWVTFYKQGIGIFPRDKSPFLYYGSMQHNHDFIGSSPVTAVARDNAGRTWVAAENDALYFIDENGINHGRLEMADGHSLTNVRSLHLDNSGNLWIGTQGSGLLKMNSATGYVTRVGEKADGTPWIPEAYISAIQDDAYGNLWVGTNGEGLFGINIATGKVIPCNALGDEGLAKGSQAISNRWVTSLAISYDEKLWIGTFYGLNRYKLKDRIMSEYEHLRKEVVTAVENDGDKGLWVGTYHGAWMIKGGEEKIFNQESGIPNDVIQSLVADHDGNVWFGTNNGLVVIRKDGSSPLVFKGMKSMGINEFSNGAATVCNNGDVIFGGLTGISIINPDRLESMTSKPKIYISGIAYNNSYVNYTSKSGSYTIVEADDDTDENVTLHFAHDYGTFAICLTNYEYVNSDDVTYMYSINGEDWIKMPDGECNVVLNNLHPDTYKIRLKCLTKNVESDEKEIKVVVHAAWYAGWLAKLIYLIIILGLIAYMIRNYRNHLLANEHQRESKRLLDLSESKLKFLIDLSHEIRTPMSMIISPVEKLISTDGENQTRRHYYDIIHNGSQRIMQLVNQMLDMSKIEQGKLKLTFRPTNITRYVENICSFMDSMAEQKGLALSFNSVLEDQELWIDNGYFDKILVNLIGNSTKFTPEGGHISVSLTECNVDEKPAVCIAVCDNGKGISPEDKAHIFERFYQSKQLANEGGLGTGLGLNLTFALVELHQGKIEVMDNPEGQGTVFLVKLLRGNEHISPDQIGPALEPKEGDVRSLATGLTDISEMMEVPKPQPVKTINERPTILVIDDDDDIRNYLGEELKETYKVITACDGGEGWRMVLKEKPDLVVTDIMMPVMDGIELCRKIRQNINVNSMPVIMLTAANTEDYQLRGLDTGADAYVNKPFSMPVLFSTIKNVLQSRQMLRNCYEGRQESDVNITDLEDVPNHDEVLLKRIIKVIEDNISNHDLNVEMLARESALSRVHLYRKLKELTNQSPSDFIRQIRLKKAGELLRKGNYNISEVARVMGFSSLAVFSRAFKDFYGVTPKEFVKE
ncbi:MAG: response regulator [Prevotella sp.]|nr:response regulator [Prevotella sp.]